VLSGLNLGNTVLVHPGDHIREGRLLKAVPLPK
jgi:hypothetical protein